VLKLLTGYATKQRRHKFTDLLLKTNHLTDDISFLNYIRIFIYLKVLLLWNQNILIYLIRATLSPSLSH
jgi:hypothetical protein